MENRFAQTDCIAEELVTGCSNITCDGADISVGNFDEKCTVVDCKTLECDDIIINSGEPVLMQGFLTQLVINETSSLPAGIFVVDEIESPFECVYIAIN